MLTGSGGSTGIGSAVFCDTGFCDTVGFFDVDGFFSDFSEAASLRLGPGFTGFCERIAISQSDSSSSFSGLAGLVFSQSSDRLMIS